MSLQLNIGNMRKKILSACVRSTDLARKSELEYAGLPAAFLPLSIAAEREGVV